VKTASRRPAPVRLGCYQDSCTGVAPAYETGRMRPRGDGAGRRVGVPGRGASRGGVGRAGRLTDELRARLSTSPLTRPEESKGLRATLRAGDHRHTPPEIAWELSLGIWLIVKGFRPSPILSADAGRARRGSSTRLPLSDSPAKAAASLVLNIGAAAVSVAATSSDTFVRRAVGSPRQQPPGAAQPVQDGLMCIWPHRSPYNSPIPARTTTSRNSRGAQVSGCRALSPATQRYWPPAGC